MYKKIFIGNLCVIFTEDWSSIFKDIKSFELSIIKMDICTVYRPNVEVSILGFNLDIILYSKKDRALFNKSKEAS